MVTNVFKVLAEGNAFVYLAQQSSFGIILAVFGKKKTFLPKWEYMQRYSITIKETLNVTEKLTEMGLLIVLKCIF